MLWMEGGWRSMASLSYIEELRDTWTVFYGPTFTMVRAALFPTDRSSSCRKKEEVVVSLYDCALTRRADWDGVPFWGVTDTIDVALARFRARGDSSDVYLGARVPLRAFAQRYEPDASLTDRITIGMWLTTATGAPIVHESSAGALPEPGQVARYTQFTGRVGSQAMMHRVEALDPSRPAGARGAARGQRVRQVRGRQPDRRAWRAGNPDPAHLHAVRVEGRRCHGGLDAGTTRHATGAVDQSGGGRNQ